jgi:hypothetical protein
MVMPVCAANVRAHFHGPLREKLMGMATYCRKALSDPRILSGIPKKTSRTMEKHGLSFPLAQLAFLDPDRVILEDLARSENEKWFSYNTQYQKMIRRLLDEYTAHQ